MTSTSRPPTLLEHLIEHDFTPVAEGAWFDHDTGEHIIRVVHQPREETQLIALAPHGACLYQASFDGETPDAVITAAVEAALSEPPPQASRDQARQATSQRRTREGRR
jgi:hypothetical protein